MRSLWDGLKAVPHISEERRASHCSRRGLPSGRPEVQHNGRQVWKSMAFSAWTAAVAREVVDVRSMIENGVA
jgi:hypothetical protein